MNEESTKLYTKNYRRPFEIQQYSVYEFSVDDVKGLIEQRNKQYETIKGLDRRIREYQEECARLQERIAHLEEANASRGESKPITVVEWQENFK